jgi:ADP-heptose:LPS heptosyltransferase
MDGFGFSVPARGDIDLRACRNILVVKLDFIGDWVLCTPFLRNLRRSAPEARITALVLERVLDLAETCHPLDRVVALDESRPKALRGRAPAQVSDFLADYARGAFDLAIVPRRDVDFWGAAPIAAGSGAPSVVGFSERCTRRKRILNRGHDRLFTDVLDARVPAHEVEHNLALMHFIGGTVTTRQAALDLTASDARAAESFLAAAIGDRRRPIIALAPFASQPKRILPLRRVAQIARSLRSRLGASFLLLGEERQAADASRLAAEIPGAVSACGRLNLRETAALLRHCALVLSTDSGPAHIAAAMRTPVLVLSCHPADGASDHPNSPLRFAPWGEPSRTRVLQPETAQRPCNRACIADRPHCILDIPKPAILAEAIRLAERRLAEDRASCSAAFAELTLV